tara:strand:+ start:8861 stop:10300 length:1440 start_codon:yes stop_codon:yes gene_type:complete
MADKIVIEAEVKSNVGEVGKDAASAAGEFKVMGVSLNGVKAAFASAGRSAKVMFGTIKAGLISTGIGVFLLAIGSLVQYFKDSEEGASKFKQITSQLGVVVGNVTDIMSNLGKAVFKLMTGDFKGFKDAIGEVADGVKDFGETTRKEMKLANQLEKDRLALQKFEREAIVEKARTEKDMMELRLKARDFEKFSAEERLGFMREANKLAAEQLEKDLHVAQEKLRFQIEENSYSKSTQQNLDDEAALQAAVFNLEKANFSERKRMKSEEQAIVKELQAAAKVAAKEISDAEIAEAKRVAAEKKIIDDAQAAADKVAADAEIKEAKRVADEEKALNKLVADTKLDTIAMGFASAKGLAKEGTAAAKAIAVAETIYNTQQSIMAAMKLPPPYNAIQAGLAGVMGAAAVAKIISTNPEGGGGAGGGVGALGAAGGGTPAPQMMSGAFDLSGGEAPDAIRAFVITDEMTSSQDQLANIRRRATI